MPSPLLENTVLPLEPVGAPGDGEQHHDTAQHMRAGRYAVIEACKTGFIEDELPVVEAVGRSLPNIATEQW